MPRKKTIKDALYTVAILVDGRPYRLYQCFCFDHSEALQEALASYRKKGFRLPVGTCCRVEGPCQKPGCGCGGERSSQVWQRFD